MATSQCRSMADARWKAHYSSNEQLWLRDSLFSLPETFSAPCYSLRPIILNFLSQSLYPSPFTEFRPASQSKGPSHVFLFPSPFIFHISPINLLHSWYIFCLILIYLFFKLSLCPTGGSNSWCRDQESHALLNKSARRPLLQLYICFLEELWHG